MLASSICLYDVLKVWAHLTKGLVTEDAIES